MTSLGRSNMSCCQISFFDGTLTTAAAQPLGLSNVDWVRCERTHVAAVAQVAFCRVRESAGTPKVDSSAPRVAVVTSSRVETRWWRQGT
jgi:hypothetical protein